MGERGGNQGAGLYRITQGCLNHGKGVVQRAQQAGEQLWQLPKSRKTDGTAVLRQGPGLTRRLGFLERGVEGTAMGHGGRPNPERPGLPLSLIHI